MSEKIVQTAGRESLGEFGPMFAHLNDDILFGEVWDEDVLSAKTKCMITVVSLMANATFEPGCRNNWHIHHAKSGGGQIPICVGGHGYYQELGKDAVEMMPGVCDTDSSGVVIREEQNGWIKKLSF